MARLKTTQTPRSISIVRSKAELPIRSTFLGLDCLSEEGPSAALFEQLEQSGHFFAYLREVGEQFEIQYYKEL